MSEPVRDQKNSRVKILDAAVQLISEVGSGKLTLDAVAERAGVSKGGLLYNFPSKDALHKAMIERLIAEGIAERERLRSQISASNNREARLAVAASMNIRGGDICDVASGLLAASAENPKLLEPVKDVIAETWRRIKSDSDDLDASMIAWLAVEAIGYMEMHGLCPLAEEDKERVAGAVERLLDNGIARAG